MGVYCIGIIDWRHRTMNEKSRSKFKMIKFYQICVRIYKKDDKY